MGKNDFNKGMEAGARPFKEKFQQLGEDTRKIGDKVNGKIDELGNIMDVVIDDLSDLKKKELYNLNTPYDLKEGLDEDEKEIMAALLLHLSKFTENNEYQKKFIRTVNAYIEVKSPQAGLDISCIENIENINSQKIMMQTAMEYLFLASEDFSFLEDLEEEVFGYFSVNQKGIREAKGYIEAVFQATGKDGIAEKYGFVPEEKVDENTIDREVFQLYKETTPYDLMLDLTKEDKTILSRLLLNASNEAVKNEYQQSFLDILYEKAEINQEPVSDEEIDLDDIDLNSQKIILQVIMEYEYLGTGDFDFMEKNYYDDFSVNKKGIRQIKVLIEKIYDAKGFDGILEKYEYMGVNEEKDDFEDVEEEAGEIYEIGQACMDRVNAHSYVELDKYLVYRKDGDDGIGYYKVHKQSGERSKVWETENEYRTGYYSKYNSFCGAGNKLYIFDIWEDNRKIEKSNSFIREINIETGEEKI